MLCVRAKPLSWFIAVYEYLAPRLATLRHSELLAQLRILRLASGGVTCLAEGSVWLRSAATEGYELSGAVRLLDATVCASEAAQACVRQLGARVATVADVVESILHRHLAVAAAHASAEREAATEAEAAAVWDELRFVRDHWGAAVAKSGRDLQAALLIPCVHAGTFVSLSCLFSMCGGL